VFDELGGVEGFGKEFKVVATLAGAGEDFYGGGLTAEENDAGVGGELADGDGGFDAVDVGHEDVREDELGGDATGGVDGFLTAVGGLGDEAAAVEDLADGVGDEGFVVDDEDAGQGLGVRRVAVWQRGGIGESFERLIGEENWNHERALGTMEWMRQVYPKKRVVFNMLSGLESRIKASIVGINLWRIRLRSQMDTSGGSGLVG
jgi:hypothetical protein